MHPRVGGSDGAAVGTGVGAMVGGAVKEALPAIAPTPHNQSHQPGSGLGADVVDDQNLTVKVHPTKVVLG